MTAPDPIVLGDVPERVWRAFQEGRGLDRAHGSHAERWRRARSLGAPPSGLRPDDALVRGGVARIRGEHVERLESLGGATLSRAAAEVSEHDFLLLLADPDGVVLRAEGGGAFSAEARALRLIEGASWGEATRGTNAIGTAATEARPTVVLGRGHFASRYHGLACYAAPVFDPDGRVAAVLDATSRLDAARPEVGAAVFAAARVLGELLRLEAYATAGGSVLRVLSRTLDHSRDAMVLVEAPGRVVRMNALAREALGGVVAGGHAAPLLGMPWPALLDAALAPTPGGVPVRGGLRLSAEPVLSPSGAPLAVVVRLEKRAPRRGRRLDPADPFAPVFAEDPSLRDAIDWARLVAKSDLPVMLLAETGSGKELFAQAIHGASGRAEGPFVPVNCGAIAPSLLESELFGYAPNAFTGADRRGRAGLFEAASGGTLFLDEVAETPLAMQAALLRVLETGRFARVGEAREEACDVRVICATCRDLDEAILAGSFRRDLYYRLKGAAVRLPSLRDRTDRLPLARRLLELRAARAGWPRPPSLSEEAEGCLAAHPWPGNVRELISVLDVALVMARGAGAEVIEARHLPPEIARAAPPSEESASTGALQRAEAAALRRAIEAHRGNVSAAARELGIARSTLYRLARRCGISVGRT
ncbi:MAG: sigma-54-dependent Fis family transcriptional regulator [Sandaracinaceae bacterium]|nr:sigma-54-dependent Fis family transcriptional regulator [Sandaracinaceae bacterium]